jgi:O-acetylhomoserine/O-acetylserine sulfhydrylase
MVAHSASKWICGHGTVIAGVVVDSGNFDWASSNRFPAFTEPTEAYHGLRYVDHFGKSAFAAKMRLELMRDIGLTLNPFAGWLLVQGWCKGHLCYSRII